MTSLHVDLYTIIRPNQVDVNKDTSGSIKPKHRKGETAIGVMARSGSIRLSEPMRAMAGSQVSDNFQIPMQYQLSSDRGSRITTAVSADRSAA